MSLISTSWRQSLAATVLAAVFGMDASADEQPADQAAEETIEVELEADVEFVAHDENGDEEIEAREARLHAALAELEKEKQKLAGRHRRERKMAEHRMQEIEEALERRDDFSEDERAELEQERRAVRQHMANVERELREPTTPDACADARARALESLKVLAERAHDLGVRLAVENLGRPPMPGATMADLLDLIDGLMLLQKKIAGKRRH